VPACGACGAELPEGARFCLQCGQTVAGGIAAPVRSPAPETYTPRDLAGKILASKAAWKVNWTIHPSLGMAQNSRATCSTVAAPAVSS
jgi:uncharacterized membrane protein YvbJ